MAHDVRQLYDECYRRLVVQLYAVTADIGEAQDCVREAFVRALDHRRTFDRTDNPEAWLRTVAVNVARGHWRRRRTLDRLLGRRTPAPTELRGLEPDHVALVGAMRMLPAAQREAIGLHYLTDLPVAEVAEVAGVPVGTVKARLSRGRARLAVLLADFHDPDRAEAEVIEQRTTTTMT